MKLKHWNVLAPAVIGIATATGCAPERPQSVPADAKSVAKQSGSVPVNFTAPTDGMVFVYDRSQQKMVYSGRVKQGETLELDPKRNNVRLEGRVVLEQQLRDLHEYQVWFDQDPSAATAGTRSQAMPTTRPSDPASR